jgi:hypothetical protein
MPPAVRLIRSACGEAMINGIAPEEFVLGSPPLNMRALECEFLEFPDDGRFHATNFGERHSRTCCFRRH